EYKEDRVDIYSPNGPVGFDGQTVTIEVASDQTPVTVHAFAYGDLPGANLTITDVDTDTDIALNTTVSGDEAPLPELPSGPGVVDPSLFASTYEVRLDDSLGAEADGSRLTQIADGTSTVTTIEGASLSPQGDAAPSALPKDASAADALAAVPAGEGPLGFYSIYTEMENAEVLGVSNHFISTYLAGNFQERMEFGSDKDAAANGGFYNRIVEMNVEGNKLTQFQSRNLMLVTPTYVVYSGFRFGIDTENIRPEDKASGIELQRYFHAMDQAMGNPGDGTGEFKGDTMTAFLVGVSTNVKGDKSITGTQYTEIGKPFYLSAAARTRATQQLSGQLEGLEGETLSHVGTDKVQRLFGILDANREASVGAPSVSRLARNDALAAALAAPGAASFNFQHYTGALINPSTFEISDEKNDKGMVLTMALRGFKSLAGSTSRFEGVLAFGGGMDKDSNPVTIGENGNIDPGSGLLMRLETAGEFTLLDIIKGNNVQIGPDTEMGFQFLDLTAMKSLNGPGST
ncbi:MAG: hypothetical protein K8I00_05690, partial [Candidatus Omnitrophica bacterium]|nr:hypothetical protein [Candidatus Omnitrophota bacterium]